MATAFEESDSAIPLTSTLKDEDDAYASDSHMSTSDTLLGNDVHHGNISQRRSVWNRIPFLSTSDRGRWKVEGNYYSGSGDKGPNRRKSSRVVLKMGLGILVVLGIVQFITILANFMPVLFPSGIHEILRKWGRPGQVGFGLSSWPTDFSRDILPIPCHSHNDYWREVPLYSAISAGCISVEADIWLYEDELFVGHDIVSLTPNRTLKNLYINPLLDILDKQNPERTLMPDPDTHLHGVFDTTPEQPLIFLIDFKTAGPATYPFLMAALEPLRSKGYLTHLNGTDLIPGPIIVVGSGDAPFDLIASDSDNPKHDIFYDAPLELMYEDPNGKITTSGGKTARSPAGRWPGSEPPSSNTIQLPENNGHDDVKSADPNIFTSQNSYYASTSFTETIGLVLDGELSAEQVELLRGQVRGAHKRGLKARYWELPFWPVGLRDRVWDVVVREGVDLLNVDDLEGATKRNWEREDGWSGAKRGVGAT